VWEYRHDAENRLVEVKRNGSLVAHYVYNGDGQRVLAVAGDEKTVYIGDYFEARMDGSIPAPVYTPEGDYNLYFPLVTGGAMPQAGRMVEPPPHTEWRGITEQRQTQIRTTDEHRYTQIRQAGKEIPHFLNLRKMGDFLLN